MNWAKVIAELETSALAEAARARNNLAEAGGRCNRGEELRAVANRQLTGANILLQLSRALEKGLQK